MRLTVISSVLERSQNRAKDVFVGVVMSNKRLHSHLPRLRGVFVDVGSPALHGEKHLSSPNGSNQKRNGHQEDGFNARGGGCLEIQPLQGWRTAASRLRAWRPREGTRTSLKTLLSCCSCKRRARPCDEDVAQIGLKRIRYLGSVGKGKLPRHFPALQEGEKVQLRSSVVGRP